MNNEHCIEICNRLLRGEQSAVASYAKAVASYEEEKAAPVELREILQDHREAVLVLTRNVRSMGGEPSHDSGAWGVFATSVQGTANLLGDEAALSSLKTGERTGKADYEAALKDEEVMPECKNLIRSELLPAVEQHIETLELLKAA